VPADVMGKSVQSFDRKEKGEGKAHVAPLWCCFPEQSLGENGGEHWKKKRKKRETPRIEKNRRRNGENPNPSASACRGPSTSGSGKEAKSCLTSLIL